MESLPCQNSSHSKRNNSLRAALLSPLIALLLLAPANLRAAIQFDAFLGLDGLVPEACWFPIVFEVYNDGPAFSGVIEVTSGMGQSGFPRLVPVELPTGTRKLITVPLFCSQSYGGEWSALLKDESGKVRAKQTTLQARTIVEHSAIILGSLSRKPGWSPSFKAPLNQSHNFKPQVARFQASLQSTVMPDNPIVMEGMATMYLNSASAHLLRSRQQSAVESWINSGGHLIVAVEEISEINSLPWLRNMLPVQLDGAQTIKPGDAFENWLRSPVKPSIAQRAPRSKGNIKPDKDAKVTVEAPYADTINDIEFGQADLQVATASQTTGNVELSLGETPLIVSTSHGLGKVTVLLFSPELEPFKSWRNQPSFWSRISELPPFLYVTKDNFYSGGYGLDGVFGAMIDSRQVRKLPIHWLLLLLVVYLAVIGPVDQIWLRKIGKPMLTWITFPCYVALFSGLIYLVGYKLRAGESEWNELHVVDVFPEQQKAQLRGRTFGSVYSPENRRYVFKSESQAAAFRGEYAGNWNTSGLSDRGEVIQTEGAFQANVFVPVWTCQLYVNEWLRADEPPFIAAVEQSGSGWKATIQNKLDRPLKNVRLVFKQAIYELEEIPGRQVKEFTSAGKTARPLSTFLRPYDNQFRTAVQARRSAFGGMESGRLTDLPNSAIAASFVDFLNQDDDYNNLVSPASFDLSEAAERNNAILFAWVSDNAPAAPMNQFAARRSQINTLWRMTLPLNQNP